MKDSSKTNQDLIAENSALKQKIQELEQTSSEKISEASERLTRQLTMLHETSVDLTAELNLDVLLQSIAQHALTLIGGKSCNCFIYRPELDLMELVTTAGDDLAHSGKMRRRGEGAVGQVLATGAPLLIKDYHTWPGRKKEYDHLPSRTLVLMPVRCGEEFLGVLNMLAYTPHRYTEADMDMLALFAAQAAIAIRNARLHDRMKTELAERKRAEEELRASEEKYRNILENIEDGYFEVDLAGNMKFFNPSLCRILGYSKDEMLGMNNRVYMDAESAKKVFRAFNEVYATGIPTKGFEWETIRKDGGRVYMEVSVSLIARPREKPTGFRGIARDITKRNKAEKELQQTLESLRKSMSATIQVMVLTVEARDPYTAGHQLKSANLARAIATEMGLPQEKIDAIRMAGSIHDIGKISIPAEILSKPTKLSEIEFSLIKEHSRRGYEMLKDVESPWPLAEIVHQHHERIDGSGYPQNLKGEEICIEARILSVADVVEAMASHRPYRAGLGIDAALNEIEKNGGTLYDKTVADACLKLFRGKGFKLEGT